METKKSPKANLENYSKLFVQLGLVLALLIVYVGIEYKTFEREIDDLGVLNMGEEVEEDIPITERIEQIKPPPPPPPAPEVIEVVEDEKEVEETMLESTETDENEVVEVEEIVEVVEAEEVAEDVPFAIIEDAPIFPGCKGSKAELKACLQKSIEKHVGRKFNTSLAGDLGLDPGKKKVYVVFKIDKSGNIVDVRARGPHARLEKEGISVVNSLPKMIPGKQRGRPVGVKYTLPITLLVE
ncbi:energy transducer TonB [Aureibaculum algae]|uniref:Energy transducer TonB n=1 Tax=Aureibaculum algae TaxID=2584122 RepID=A0A5B7TRD8_9FLAO|nr:energy transducer TonB [Aureibaculum algae]QCX37527.1 energy transducer TonB [Aureibaculum algae]